jgi:hypothetical protein
MVSNEYPPDVYYTVEYPQIVFESTPKYVIDSGGEWLYFSKIKPVFDASFISIGFDDDFNFYEEHSILSVNNMQDFSLQISPSSIPNSGLSFTDEEGRRRFFYITYSGEDGSVGLREFQNTPPDEYDFIVETVDVRGLGLELEYGIKITGYTGSKWDVKIPSQIKNLYITHIGESAFFEKSLISINIPDSVIAIEEYAFANNQITSIIIPDNVISIGNYAFCKNKLTSITISNSVREIGSNAFDENQIISVIIPNSVNYIGSQAFFGNQLTSIIIPDSVIEIGNWAFSNNQLTSVIIPHSISSIGRGTFYNNQLTNITIPDSITEIGPEAFALNRLTSIYIPDSVTVIGNNAFSGNQLTTVNIGDEPKIGNRAFENEYIEDWEPGG